MAQNDIIQSGAWLWYAPEGEPFPDETAVDVGDDWGGNWEWVGLTTTPLTEAVNAETSELDVQQIPNPILQTITSEVRTLSVTLAEMTAPLLQLLDGGNITTTAAGAGQRGFTELRAGGRTTRTVYTCGFEVRHSLPDGTLLPLRVFYHRVTFARGGDVPYDKANPSATPIQITVLGDDEQPEGEKLYVWQKVTAEATS